MGPTMPGGLLMPRYLTLNGIAAAIGLGVWLTIDVIYVLLGGGIPTFLDVAGPLIFIVAIVAFLRANWEIATGGFMRRFVKAILLSLPPFVLWLAISTVTLLWFHPMIGGKE